MKKIASLVAFAAIALFAMQPTVTAQDCGSCSSGGEVVSSCGGGGGIGHHQGGCAGGGCTVVGYESFDASAVTQGRRYHPMSTLRNAKKDHFSPHRVYAYSHHGVDATLTDNWNQSRMQSTSWNGNYNYWRWGAPTALVVPPTAAFQSSYAWGVGQTRSMPINHQFGRAGGGGMSGGGGGAGAAPYWPSSTDKLGVYPVRGPWE